MICYQPPGKNPDRVDIDVCVCTCIYYTMVCGKYTFLVLKQPISEEEDVARLDPSMSRAGPCPLSLNLGGLCDCLDQ